jgi:hypothetical protein
MRSSRVIVLDELHAKGLAEIGGCPAKRNAMASGGSLDNFKALRASKFLDLSQIYRMCAVLRLEIFAREMEALMGQEIGKSPVCVQSRGDAAGANNDRRRDLLSWLSRADSPSAGDRNVLAPTKSHMGGTTRWHSCLPLKSR